MRIGARTARVAVSLAVYAAWVLCTWLLEGRLHTLLRPDAVRERALYAVAANIVVGTGLALVAFAWWSRHVGLRPSTFGFPSGKRTLVATLLALVAAALLVGPRFSTHEPAVLVNAAAQVLVTSIAEVTTCWLLLGGAVRATLHPRSARSWVLGAAVASVAFGLAHFAHSPPFNTWEHVLKLTLVGGLTSVVFVLSRDLIATIVFHNALGMFGVLQALAAADALEAYARVRAPLLVMAAAALIVVVVAELLLRGVGMRTPRHPRHPWTTRAPA